MAQNFELLFCVSLLLLLLLPLQYSNSENPTTQKLSPFESLKKFQGSKKGENIVGLHELKQYLNKFGYLQNDHFSKANLQEDDDNFDDSLEAAIKTYQANYNLKITGTLNSETLSKMMVPRCGVPDVINGTNYMRKHGHNHHHHPKSVHTVAHYAFFPGRPKWPADKTHLTYAFDASMTQSYRPAFVAAFGKWASYTQQYFTFSQTYDYKNADLTIGFRRGDHGDGYSFDGPRGILAHSFAPTDGRLHCDADERWSIGAVPNYYDIKSVAVHEIGHLLGLGHSSVEAAIMYPSLPSGVSKVELQDDDLQGIKALYNI